MNTLAKPKPILRVEARHIGPIMHLQQELSSEKQNLIFARNGTGKSFIARALRFFDHTVYTSHDQSGVSDLLVSEESQDGKGTFRLYEGQTCIGSLELDTRTRTVTRSKPSYIFHVFTEDYIDEVVRNRLEELDGRITHEIIIGRENVELDQKESELSKKQETVRSGRETLATAFSQRRDKHKAAFAIVGSLRAFKELGPDTYFSTVPYSLDPTCASVEELRSQYNAFKALPTDPILPRRLNFEPITLDVQSIHDALVRTTSPSTVVEEFKIKIETDREFLEAGLELYKGRPDECPFCAQPMGKKAVDVVSQYVEYFQDAEAREKDALNTMTQQIQTTIGRTEQWKIEHLRECTKYDGIKGHLPSISDKEWVDPSQEIEKILRYLGGLKDGVEEKLKDLTNAVTLPAANINSAMDDLLSVAATNNALVDEIGNVTNDTSSERRSIQNASCVSFENRFFEENRETIDQIRALEGECRGLSGEIEELKLTHGQSTSARGRVAMTFSKLLERFFENKYTFDSATFKVRRKNREMRRGSDRTLSDGEKAVLAFCYFVAQTHLRVNEIEDYGKLYFVFDDPVTSMSFDYIYTIVQSLKLLRISADGDIQFNLQSDQYRPRMLILTHNNYFFNVASANRVVRTGGLFQLVPGDDVHELASQAPFATPHMLQLRDVRDVVEGKKRADHTTPNSVRSVIEGVWKFCRPDFNNFEEFLAYLMREHQMEIKSVLINDLSHGGKVADFPHDEQDIRRAAAEAIEVVRKFAGGQLNNL